MTVSITAAFLCGFVAVLFGSLMVAFSLAFTGKAFFAIARMLVIAHLPVMVIEGLITTFCIRFIKQVKPEILEVIYAR